MKIFLSFESNSVGIVLAELDAPIPALNETQQPVGTEGDHSILYQVKKKGKGRGKRRERGASERRSKRKQE